MMDSKYSAWERSSLALFSFDCNRSLGRTTFDSRIASNIGVGIDLTESPPALRRDDAILVWTD